MLFINRHRFLTQITGLRPHISDPAGTTCGESLLIRRILVSFSTHKPIAWIVLRDKDGKLVLNDNLRGYGASQSDAEAFLYILPALYRFRTKKSVKSSFSATRPYYRWNFDEYVVAMGSCSSDMLGDMSHWAWFRRDDLTSAIGNSSLFSETMSFPINAYTSWNPNRTRSLNAHFQNGRWLLIVLDLADGYNSSRRALYGEIGTPVDPSYSSIGLLSHDGINVFVRNSNPNASAFSIFLAFHLIECGDGYRTLPEECDDGNINNGDGCSSTCRIEANFYCKRGSYNDLFVSDYPCCHISCEDCTISGDKSCSVCRVGFELNGLSCVGTNECIFSCRSMRGRQKDGPARM